MCVLRWGGGDITLHCHHQKRVQELCVEVEVGVLGSPSLIVLTVSVDVKQHLKKKTKTQTSELRS